MARSFDLKKVLAPVDDVVRRLKTRRDELLAEARLIDDQISRFSGAKGSNGRSAQTFSNETERAKPRGSRKRRSRADLEAQAKDVVAFIADKGKDGVTGREIKAKFGDLLPSVNAWLKSYARGAKVKTTGARASMKYHAG